MKLAASRSLLHGTVGSGARASASAMRSTCGHQLDVARRQPEAALLDERQVAALHVEHVEVAVEARAGVQHAAHLGRADERALVAQVLGL